IHTVAVAADSAGMQARQGAACAHGLRMSRTQLWLQIAHRDLQYLPRLRIAEGPQSLTEALMDFSQFPDVGWGFCAYVHRLLKGRDGFLRSPLREIGRAQSLQCLRPDGLGLGALRLQLVDESEQLRRRVLIVTGRKIGLYQRQLRSQ